MRRLKGVDPPFLFTFLFERFQRAANYYPYSSQKAYTSYESFDCPNRAVAVPEPQSLDQIKHRISTTRAAHLPTSPIIQHPRIPL